ncbi:hypothetical protein FHS20_003745 [Phyllobacterium endophyticum]|nr:hypothetical protein [Phyllobacterium endophyticum]
MIRLEPNSHERGSKCLPNTFDQNAIAGLVKNGVDNDRTPAGQCGSLLYRTGSCKRLLKFPVNKPQWEVFRLL